MVIPKPNLRGFALREAKIAGYVSFPLAILSAVTLYNTACKARIRRYEEFYKTYNVEEKLQIMCDSGYMQSCGEYKLAE